MPPIASRIEPPIDEAGVGGGWVVVKFFLHAAAGVFSGRVLLLTLAAGVVAEGGFTLLVAPKTSADGRLFSPSVGVGAGVEPSNLLRAGLENQAEAAWVLVDPFGVTRSGARLALRRVLGGVWRVAVWGLFGVALARVAATHLTHHDRPSAAGALRHAFGGWLGQAVGPLAIALLAGAFAGVVWTFGYASRLELIGGAIALAWPIVIAAALLGGLLAIAFALGTPLIWSAQAVEEPDPFDAVSRGVAYVFQRPLRLVAYVAQAGLIGAIAGALLLGVVEITWRVLSLWFAGLGVSPGAGEGFVLTAANGWLWAFLQAPTLFHAAYFWFATTAIYLLLRRDIDEKPCDEIYVAAPSPSSDEEAA